MKIPAIIALGERDPARLSRGQYLRAVQQLVIDLDNDDFAVRMYAIAALERLTGERRGFDPHHDDEQRAESLERWREFVRELAPVTRPPGTAGQVEDSQATG